MAPTAYTNSTYLDAYAAARGVTLATGDKTAALVRASMALDALYALRFPGEKTDYTQDRQWPRTGATWPDGTPISGTPDQILQATSELAIQELISPGSMTPIVTPGKVKKRARVEGAVDVTYAVDSDVVESQMPVLTVVEGILWGLIGTRQVLPGALVV
jgi:hypothetical protein